jgi:hypothetical protein
MVRLRYRKIHEWQGTEPVGRGVCSQLESRAALRSMKPGWPVAKAADVTIPAIFTQRRKIRKAALGAGAPPGHVRARSDAGDSFTQSASPMPAFGPIA